MAAEGNDAYCITLLQVESALTSPDGFTDTSWKERDFTATGHSGSSVQKKFGSYAGVCALGSALQIQDSTDPFGDAWDIGTGPWAVDAWIKLDYAFISGDNTFDLVNTSSGFIIRLASVDVAGTRYLASTITYPTSGLIVTNYFLADIFPIISYAWIHYAFERDEDGLHRIFISGTAQPNTATNTEDLNLSSDTVKLLHNPGTSVSGYPTLYWEELRVSVTERYGADFALNTEAYDATPELEVGYGDGEISFSISLTGTTVDTGGYGSMRIFPKLVGINYANYGRISAKPTLKGAGLRGTIGNGRMSIPLRLSGVGLAGNKGTGTIRLKPSTLHGIGGNWGYGSYLINAKLRGVGTTGIPDNSGEGTISLSGRFLGYGSKASDGSLWYSRPTTTPGEEDGSSGTVIKYSR